MASSARLLPRDQQERDAAGAGRTRIRRTSGSQRGRALVGSPRRPGNPSARSRSRALRGEPCCSWGDSLLADPVDSRALLRQTSDSDRPSALAGSARSASRCACSRPSHCGAAARGKGKSAPTSTRLLLLGTSDSATEALAECCSTEQSGHDLAVGMSASGCWNRTEGVTTKKRWLRTRARRTEVSAP